MHRLKIYATGLALVAALGQNAVPAWAAVPSSTESSSLREAVRLASSSRQISAVYKTRDFRPIWFRGSTATPDAHRLIDVLSRADLDGLDPDDYRIDRLNDAMDAAKDGDPKTIARADVQLCRALIKYVRDLHRPTKSGMTFVDKSLAPARPSPPQILEAASSRSLEAAFLMHPLYVQLRLNYAAWNERWGHLPEIAIPAGPTLSAKSRGERVRLLRARLGLPAGTSFDKAVAAAVRDFKSAYGLPATSIVDDQTIALLNQPIRYQEARIRINLARARMLPSPTIGRYVLVDAAAQRLWLYDGDRPVDSMKVIVGKPSEPTPMMAAVMRYATINPYWYVPPDLVAKRIAPNVLTDGAAYLNAKGYEVMSNWTDDAQRIDPATVDWKAVADGRKELPVRQLPGPANMMGAMKFMFPNAFGVYLHDTPDKALFTESDRRRSSGCVRLEDAKRLARALFGTVPTAPPSAAEHNVALPRPVPVYITYLTVAPQELGIAFRDDVYGRDGIVPRRVWLSHAESRPGAV